MAGVDVVLEQPFILSYGNHAVVMLTSIFKILVSITTA